jgi:formate C-acetyltransferase
MNERIQYLKDNIRKNTADIDAYREIKNKSFAESKGMSEIFRKAKFLSDFAANIPVELDENELICGSLRFWRCDGSGSHNMGHIIVDYEMLINDGLPTVREKIEQLSTIDAKAFKEALTAFELFIKRYADEADARFALNGNHDMNRVANNCRQLLRGRPENFEQALQLIWFVHVFLHAEGANAAVSFGRFDEYLYPLYKKDIECGIAKEYLKELISCFWIKTCEGDESQNLTLGGGDENELTLVCLEVTTELKLWQPSVSVRINEKTTDQVWKAITDLIKVGIGMPALFNDTVITAALRNIGISEIDAENYGIVGCYEANPCGNTYGTTAAGGTIFLHNILLEFLCSEKSYVTFSDFYSAFLEFFKTKYETDILNAFRWNWGCIKRDCVSPFQGLCFRDCLNSGLAAENGGCKYTMFGINILGIGTLIDSIYCIKKLVFEEKFCSYQYMVSQVKENFPDEELFLRCRRCEGKFGTDSEETNIIAQELSLFISNLVDSGIIEDGVIPYAGLFIFLGDVNSSDYPATPDGRRAGERLSYGIGASDIAFGKTVTSILNSSACIANDHFADGNPLMIRLNTSDVSGEKGDMILRTLISTYFEKGGFHIQCNVVDVNTLKDAQKNPEKYSDLTVRISGFSARFITLSASVQNALIERM